MFPVEPQLYSQAAVPATQAQMLYRIAILLVNLGNQDVLRAT